MNTDTGELYVGWEEVLRARQSGAPVAEISQEAAKKIQAGYDCMNRAQRRQADRELRQQAKFRS